MLEVRNLYVGYGRTEVVHGIDLAVQEGQVMGMIGPNGAGKSSVLRAISGLLAPMSGEIYLDGRRIDGRRPEEISGFGVMLVPEGRQVFRTLTVAENLQVAVRHRDATAVSDALKRFPILRDRATQPADRLSGGEQQQLAIARALVARPTLLLIDEPSLGLSPRMIDVIYETLSELSEEGVSMLLVEQNAARTIDFCDSCVVLSGGEVQVRGDRTELKRHPHVVSAYLGRQP